MKTLYKLQIVSCALLGIALPMVASAARAQPVATTAADIVCEYDSKASDGEAAEAACLARPGVSARRQGLDLILRLRNKTIKVYRSNFKACEDGDPNTCVVYRLISYLPSRGYFVVEAAGWEGGDWRLVRETDGLEITLAARPEFSPSGKLVVSVSANEAYGPNRIEVWSLAGMPREQFRFDVPETVNTFYDFVGWEGDGRIKLNVRLWVGKEHKTLPGEVVRTREGVWSLRDPKTDSVSR